MKKNFKLVLLWISSIIYRNRKSKIIYYHDVYGKIKYTNMGTSLKMFEKHIKTVQDNGFVITDKIIKPEGEVMICFDDGFRGIYDTKQFFIDHNIYPTVFLAISLIGKPGYLNEMEILELQDAGFIFQCHAWSHTDLTGFTVDELQRELGESKQFLSELLRKEVDEICFPIGYFSQLVLDECKRYGYKTMYSSIPGNYFDKFFVDGLKTRNLLQFADEAETGFILLGGNEIIMQRYIKLHHRLA